MHCKACDCPIEPRIRTDHPEHEGVLWEDLCSVCKKAARVFRYDAVGEEWELGVDDDGTFPLVQVTAPAATTLYDIEDLLEEWGIKNNA